MRLWRNLAHLWRNGVAKSKRRPPAAGVHGGRMGLVRGGRGAAVGRGRPGAPHYGVLESWGLEGGHLSGWPARAPFAGRSQCLFTGAVGSSVPPLRRLVPHLVMRSASQQLLGKHRSIGKLAARKAAHDRLLLAPADKGVRTTARAGTDRDRDTLAAWHYSTAPHLQQRGTSRSRQIAQ